MTREEVNAWVDASSLVMAVALESNGTVLEDICWLCPTGDVQYINIAEFDAML